MPPSSVSLPAQDPAMEVSPSLAALFTAFATISISAFGGALPWARHVLVERRRWLSENDFTRMLALCQFLPGPNIVNICIAAGTRLRGPAGALACLTGLLLPAFTVVVLLGDLYGRYGRLDGLRGLFSGIAAAATGLIVAMTAKLAVPLLRERPVSTLPFMAAAFVTVALLHWPLGLVLLGLAPLSVATTWWHRR